MRRNVYSAPPKSYCRRMLWPQATESMHVNCLVSSHDGAAGRLHVLRVPQRHLTASTDVCRSPPDQMSYRGLRTPRNSRMLSMRRGVDVAAWAQTRWGSGPPAAPPRPPASSLLCAEAPTQRWERPRSEDRQPLQSTRSYSSSDARRRFAPPPAALQAAESPGPAE